MEQEGEHEGVERVVGEVQAGEVEHAEAGVGVGAPEVVALFGIISVSQSASTDPFRYKNVSIGRGRRLGKRRGGLTTARTWVSTSAAGIRA